MKWWLFALCGIAYGVGQMMFIFGTAWLLYNGVRLP